MDKAKFQKTVWFVIKLLVEKRYDELVALSQGKRLPAEHLQRAVHEYGRQLVNPPSQSLKDWDIYEITDSSPTQWAVDVPLWTKEERRSDLTLSMTLTESNDEIYKVELDDLHVL